MDLNEIIDLCCIDSSDIFTNDSREHYIKNLATDCAINQQIRKQHLPEYGIFPETLEQMINKEVPIDKDAEFYYELIEDSDDFNSSDGTNQIDDHDIWEESDHSPEMQREVTKKMIESSLSKTIKSKGDVPQNIDEILDLHKYKPKVSWKKETRKIVGNRKTNIRSTILRKNRRFPNRIDLKGKTKDRSFDVCVVLDVSGSMSTEDIMQGLNELKQLCDLTNSSMKLIQVDTEIHSVEEFSKNTKIFNRKGSGGTIMEPGMTYIYKNKIPSDLVILITDGYIEDISTWEYPPKRMFALVTENVKIEGIESYGSYYKQFDIKDV